MGRFNAPNLESVLSEFNIHPGKSTWNLKITQLKRKIIFQTTVFRFHVTLPGRVYIHQEWWLFPKISPRLEKWRLMVGVSMLDFMDVLRKFRFPGE